MMVVKDKNEEKVKVKMKKKKKNVKKLKVRDILRSLTSRFTLA